MAFFSALTLAADESDAFKDSPFLGSLSGAQTVIGIVLIVTGALLLYFGVKMKMGYRFFPESGETVVEEDNYAETRAAVGESHITTLPDIGSGERELTEFDISYTVDGTEYKQTVPDEGYKTGDVIKLKYNPESPNEFYLSDTDTEAEDEESSSAQEPKNISALIVIALGVLVAAAGIALLL